MNEQHDADEHTTALAAAYARAIEKEKQAFAKRLAIIEQARAMNGGKPSFFGLKFTEDQYNEIVDLVGQIYSARDEITDTGRAYFRRLAKDEQEL